MKKFTVITVKILLASFILSSCSEGTSYGEPKQLITKEIAKTLNTNYNTKRANVINASIQREDANAIWYSLEELENYINYIKNEGKNKGYEVNGIRMYLGVYPETTEYAEKQGMTTIFLSPTGNKVPLSEGNFLTNTTATDKNTNDIEEINPLNYGSMGNPPKIAYPVN